MYGTPPPSRTRVRWGSGGAGNSVRQSTLYNELLVFGRLARKASLIHHPSLVSGALRGMWDAASGEGVMDPFKHD